MLYIIVIAAMFILLVFWIMSVQRSFVVMDENINNAMSQISIQLSSRWDALSVMLDLTKGYAAHEYETLAESIQARQPITKNSTPKDINKQENIITEMIGKVVAIAEKYPEMKADKSYLKILDAVGQYENMVRTSRLIYNDSITKLNQAIRRFPAFLIAGALGFSKREYLETTEDKANRSSVK